MPSGDAGFGFLPVIQRTVSASYAVVIQKVNIAIAK